jgi:DNA-binding IclR family transcriptional regulator
VGETSSGIGVLDKSILIVDAVAQRPLSLAELLEVTGLPRATAHRLAVALQSHRLLARSGDGRFVLGPRAGELAARQPDPLLAAAQPALVRIRDESGESSQLYRREGAERVCAAAAERLEGLRTTVPVGSRLPLTAGSGAQVLCAWADPDSLVDLLAAARFTNRQLAGVRRRGWAHTVGQREPGVASVSAPVFDGAGRVVAAISISGPIERLGRNPGPVFAPVLQRGAEQIAARLEATVRG